MKAHPVRMTIANTHDYALRRLDNPIKYTQVSGEIQALGQEKYRRDLKFRAFGTPLECSPGVKELHLGVKGALEYNVLASATMFANNQGSYTESERERIRRYHYIMADIDIELWAFADAMPMPIRSASRVSEIDSDWTPNAPLSRIRVTQQVDLYDTPFESGGIIDVIEALFGVRKHRLSSFTATPIVIVDTLAPIVVPVVTMHIGGRTLSAEGIKASFELQGKAFYG